MLLYGVVDEGDLSLPPNSTFQSKLFWENGIPLSRIYPNEWWQKGLYHKYLWIKLLLMEDW